jgi:hypothetical protein
MLVRASGPRSKPFSTERKQANPHWKGEGSRRKIRQSTTRTKPRELWLRRDSHFRFNRRSRTHHSVRRSGQNALTRGIMLGEPSASSHYWLSSSYSWPSRAGLKIRRREAVNNSAAVEMIMADKLMKLLVELVLGKRARTGLLRICIADRSTIITILSSGAGRAFIRNESSDEEPVRGLRQ